MIKTILSLYDFSGQFSNAYRTAGYEVIQVDYMLNGIDVRLMKHAAARSIHGIIACPPCTYFSQANKIPSIGQLQEGLSCADAVFRLVCIYRPQWYVIENPAKSRLWQYIGKPKQIVNLNWFGYSAIKPTGLYGSFNPIKLDNTICNTNPVKFEQVKKSERSTTPLLLGDLFFQSNP